MKPQAPRVPVFTDEVANIIAGLEEPPLLEKKYSRISDCWSYIDYYRLDLKDWLRRFGAALILIICGGALLIIPIIDPLVMPLWHAITFAMVAAILSFWGIYEFLKAVRRE